MSETILTELSRELDEYDLSEAEKKEILRKLIERYVLLLLESAKKAAKKGGVTPEIRIEDIKSAAEIIGVTSINPEIIRRSRDQATQWLLQEGTDGTWGWWCRYDPKDLRDPIIKIWSTAMVVKCLLRAGISPKTPQVVNGVRWLVENRITDPGPSWSRLPLSYKGKTTEIDCFAPNTYETSCVLLALQEAQTVQSCDKRVIRDGIKNLINCQHRGHQGHYWSTFLTEESRHPDLGATSLALMAISRAKKNGFVVNGIQESIGKAVKWIMAQQRERCNAWGEMEEIGSTTKTSDAIRALVESGDRRSKVAIDGGVGWLLKNQGVVEDGRGWGWRKTDADQKLIASTIENTAFALIALMKAGKPCF